MKLRLVEDLPNTVSYDALLSVLKDNFGSDTPPIGVCYLISDGTFIAVPEVEKGYVPQHGDEVKWLIDNGYIMDKSQFKMFGKVIDLNDGYYREEEHRIALPSTQPTSAQYIALQEWIEETWSRGYVDSITVMVHGKPLYQNYELSDIPSSNYIINRIKRMYATGQLYA